MRTNLIVIDNFYANPDEVRAFALSQTFDVKGNYPGLRTKSFINDHTKEGIERTIHGFAGKVVDWMDKEEDSYSGAFQLTYAVDRTWIHTDPMNNWAGVCYLTPDAPLSGGTGIYRHKKTKMFAHTFDNSLDDDSYDYTKWEMVDRVGNLYNRLVIYRGDLFHASLDYFGNTPDTGRLFQVFFFNTEF